MLNEEVRTIMTDNPAVVQASDKIQEVYQKMTTEKLQQVPVVNGGKLVGLLTSYDLWQYSLRPENDMSVPAEQVMTTKVLTITPKDKVGTAAELFIDKRFKTLPVVNLDNDLKGVITAFDVIKHCFKKEYPNPILYKEELQA